LDERLLNMSRKYEDYKEAAFVKLLEVYDPNEKINSDNECNKKNILYVMTYSNICKEEVFKSKK